VKAPAVSSIGARLGAGDGYRKLAYATAAMVFLLIVVGGIVRVSDSGLGCGAKGSGTQGWPLCGGRVVPIVDTHMVVEYTHRFLAATVTVMVASLALFAWRRHRTNRALVRTSIAAFVLIIVQASLGGLTVEKGLKEELVATHLGVAMLQIGLILLIARLSRPVEERRPASERPGTTRAIRTLAVVASVLVLGTIVAGGYMAASELEGTGLEHTGADAHVACGKDFPSCNGGFLPFGQSRSLDIHLTHRAFMYLASIAVLGLFALVLAQRRRLDPRSAEALTRLSGLAVAILAAQVLLGAMNVWLGEHAWLVVTHLTVGTLLWLTLALFTMRVIDARQPAGAPARQGARVEAAHA
jgi:heme A synthase